MRSIVRRSSSAPAGSGRPTTIARARPPQRCSGWRCTKTTAVLERIRARFAGRQLAMPEINRRQALVPEGAALIANDRGTAPGLWLPTASGGLLLLPGPPREMAPMLADALERHVAPRWGVTASRRRVVTVAGRSESWVDEQLQPIYGPWAIESPAVATTVLASLGVVEVHLSVAGGAAADLDARLEAAVAALTAPLGPDVVSVDGRGLEQVVGDALVARGWRLGVAESCTGGLITSRLTDVPGSSAYLERAVVAYSNAAKIDLLGVARADLDAHGAVSEPVAAAMAAGLRAASGVEVAARHDRDRRPRRRHAAETRRHGVHRHRRPARPRGADVAVHR